MFPAGGPARDTRPRVGGSQPLPRGCLPSPKARLSISRLWASHCPDMGATPPSSSETWGHLCQVEKRPQGSRPRPLQGCAQSGQSTEEGERH